MQSHRCASNSRDIGMIIGWRNLNDIGADNVERIELSQHRQHLGRGGTACHRRSRARSKCWIEAVDIESHIGFDAIYPAGNRGSNFGCLHLLDVVAMKDFDAEIVRRMRAYADLNRAARIDDAILNRSADK